jgi:hypothetical protein
MMSATALAQQGRGPGAAGPPAVENAKRATQERVGQEYKLRSAEMGSTATGVDPQRVLEAIEIVKHDFKRIQVVRNEMVDNLVANKPLDYKLISEQAGEINKRAQRLKTFLMPPVPEEKEKAQKNHLEYRNEEMKGALVKLCNLIFVFTENPVLKTPDVVDLEQSAKAGRELLSMIELSDNIKRSAEKLRRELR